MSFDKQIEKKKLLFSKQKAEIVIAELEIKILERKNEIERLEDHIKIQQNIVNDVLSKLEGEITNE